MITMTTSNSISVKPRRAKTIDVPAMELDPAAFTCGRWDSVPPTPILATRFIWPTYRYPMAPCPRVRSRPEANAPKTDRSFTVVKLVQSALLAQLRGGQFLLAPHIYTATATKHNQQYRSCGQKCQRPRFGHGRQARRGYCAAAGMAHSRFAAGMVAQCHRPAKQRGVADGQARNRRRAPRDQGHPRSPATRSWPPWNSMCFATIPVRRGRPRRASRRCPSAC